MKRLDVNLRKSRIGYRDETGAWYGLDNAAVIMPAVANPIATYLFRLSAGLDEPVNVEALQKALERVAARFHYFVVELRRGVFWHYLEPHPGTPRAEADSDSPCQGFNMHRRGTCLLRVRARGNRIACEFSHVLTDGTGGVRFLKNLLVEYFRLRGTLPSPGAEPDPDLYDLDSPVEPEETEDAYNRYFPENYPFPEHERPAWAIPGGHLPRGQYRVICGVMPVAASLAVAKKFGCSLTEFLTAVYMEALQEVWLSVPEAMRRRARPRIAIEVPVNMRKYHATPTNRNFSLFVHADQDMRLGRREFADIAAKIHHQLRFMIDGPNMARHISRNVTGGRVFFIRALPLLLKSPLMRILFSYYGENIVSGVMSNLGPMQLPAGIAERVERFDFIPAPSLVLKTKASVVSWKDSLYFSFGSLGVSRELERHFFTRLRTLGIPVRIECNLEEDE